MTKVYYSEARYKKLEERNQELHTLLADLFTYIRNGKWEHPKSPDRMIFDTLHPQRLKKSA